jgi:competence protein ComEA
LTKSDQLFVGCCIAALLALLGAHALRLSGFGRHPIDVERLPDEPYVYLVDINQSTWVEWAQFDGVGETLARRIVEERERNGPYQSIEDLLRVRGLGARRLAQMRPNLRVVLASPPRPAEERPASGAEISAARQHRSEERPNEEHKAPRRGR